MFDLLSDLHIDREKDKNIIIKKLLKSHSNNNLIIAGDISDNYTDLENTLIALSKEYKNVIFVFGNHDLFITKKDKPIFFNSLEKIEYLKNKNIDNLHILDGDMITIDNFIIGGCSGWYDGKYSLVHLNQYYTKNYKYLDQLWSNYIDFKMLNGFESFKEYFFDQEKKIELMHNKVDIMVTHINPSIKKEYVDYHYRNDDITSFFTFDGSHFMRDGSMFAWIYGHTHSHINYEEFGVECINAYPIHNKNDIIMKTLNINKNLYN